MLNVYQLERLIEDSMQAAKVPGLSLVIIRDLEIVYAKGFGVTSVDDGGAPVKPNTIFRIGSTSKPLTAAAVMRLVESGKLELDTPLVEILPTLEFSEKNANQHITLRRLLSHTSGLSSAEHYVGSHDLARFRDLTCAQIPRYAFVAPVGKVWSYSNSGIDLAGYVAEAVTGTHYAQLMQEYVFDPLDMKRTTFDPTVAMTYSLAQSHDIDDDGNLYVQRQFSDNVEHYPSGFVMSTALDLANFAIMNMNGGRFRDGQFLKPDSVAEMHQRQASFLSLNNAGYGLAFAVHDYKGVRRVGHGGRIDTFASKFEMAPAAGAAVIMLSNRCANWTLYEEKITRFILDGLLDLPADIPAPAVIQPDKSRWPQYTGCFAGANGGMAKIEVENETLTLDLEGSRFALKAAAHNLYYADRADPILPQPVQVGFIEEPDGSVDYISVIAYMNIAVPLKRAVYDPAYQPNPAAWAAYPGIYHNESAELIVLRENDQLFIRYTLYKSYSPPVKVPLPLAPLDDRRFASPLGLITFDIDEGKRVSAVHLGWATTFTPTA